MADQERKHGHRIADSIRKEERKSIQFEKDRTAQARYIESYTISGCSKKKERRD
jgi:hypothetical protein